MPGRRCAQIKVGRRRRPTEVKRPSTPKGYALKRPTGGTDFYVADSAAYGCASKDTATAEVTQGKYLRRPIRLAARACPPRFHLMTVLSHEPLIRLACFAGVFAVLALWELRAPRRVQEIGRASRWPANLGVVIVDTLVLRLLFPTAAVGAAL